MSNNYFVKKNLKLSLAFDNYINKYPAILNKIPNDSLVVFTVRGDEAFNKMSWVIAGRAYAEKDKVIEARKEGHKWNVRKFEPV
jgi:hypothetical protein